MYERDWQFEMADALAALFEEEPAAKAVVLSGSLGATVRRSMVLPYIRESQSQKK